MGTVPQLDFDVFPSQIFWFFVAFVLLYSVMRTVVVPRIETTIRRRVGTEWGELDDSAGVCRYLKEELSAQERRLRELEADVMALTDRANNEVKALMEEARSMLDEELACMFKNVDENLAALKKKATDEMVLLSAEIARAYCLKVGHNIHSKDVDGRLKGLSSRLYKEKLW